MQPWLGSFFVVQSSKIREAPRGGILATAEKQTEVGVMEEKAGWSKVKLKNGEVGWIETASLFLFNAGQVRPAVIAPDR